MRTMLHSTAIAMYFLVVRDTADAFCRACVKFGRLIKMRETQVEGHGFSMPLCIQASDLIGQR